jgi:hypothetical protein
MKNPSNQLNETISNHHMYPEITIDIQEIISIIEKK